MRALRPAAALLDPSQCVAGPVCLVEQGRIVRWCEADELPAGLEVEEFPDELWVAPPRLLHAHLESFDAPCERWTRTSFASWVAALLRWRMNSGGQRMSSQDSAEASCAELAAAGCGFVLSARSEPGAELPPQVQRRLPIDVEVWPELFEPDPSAAEAAFAEFEQGAAASVRGLALHAPFSVSPELARRAFAWAQAPGRYLSIHLGEHEEERALLQTGGGPLGELFDRRGRARTSACWDSPVAWLESVAPGLRPRTLAVHAGDLKASELRQLMLKRVDVVFCPGTHRYFERPEPAFAEAGMAAPLLGCDSRASNDMLDPFRELRLAATILPQYEARAWWGAVTTRAAAALGQSSSEGSLLPGRRARVLRLRDPGLREAGALCDSLVRAGADHLPPTPAQAPATDVLRDFSDSTS